MRYVHVLRYVRSSTPLPPAIVVLSCAFFVVAFGFRFGPIVSRAFMVSAVVSFILSGLIVQPLTILVFAFVRYRLFRAFVSRHVRVTTTRAPPRWWEVLTNGTYKQVIPDFRPADSHHFQKLVLNDGGPTALTAVLVANSVRNIDEVEAAWDDDEEYTQGRLGKPLPGAGTTHLPLPGVVKLKPSIIETGGAQRAPRPPKSPARPPSTTSTLLSSRQSPAVMPSDALVDRGPTPPTFTMRRVLRAKNHPGQLRPAAFDVLPSPRQPRRGLPTFTARSQSRAESRTLSRASRSPATFDTEEATAVSFTLDDMSSSDSLSIGALHDVQTTSRRGRQ